MKKDASKAATHNRTNKAIKKPKCIREKDKGVDNSGGLVMTYKIELGLGRTMSSILLRFPDGHTASFSSGEEVCRAMFDRKYRVVEMRAVENTVEIKLEHVTTPMINPIGEETFF